MPALPPCPCGLLLLAALPSPAGGRAAASSVCCSFGGGGGNCCCTGTAAASACGCGGGPLGVALLVLLLPLPVRWWLLLLVVALAAMKSSTASSFPSSVLMRSSMACKPSRSWPCSCTTTTTLSQAEAGTWKLHMRAARLTDRQRLQPREQGGHVPQVHARRHRPVQPIPLPPLLLVLLPPPAPPRPALLPAHIDAEVPPCHRPCHPAIGHGSAASVPPLASDLDVLSAVSAAWSCLGLAVDRSCCWSVLRGREGRCRSVGVTWADESGLGVRSPSCAGGAWR